MEPDTGERLFWLVVEMLCAYRLTRLVVADSFPPVERARAWIVKRYTTETPNPDGSVTIEPGWLAELVDCPYCAGVWVSALVVGVATWAAPWSQSIVLTLMEIAAVAAVAGNLSSWLDD